MNEPLQPLADWPVYRLPRAEKRLRLEAALWQLTRHHAAHCEAYGRILAARGVDLQRQGAMEDLPMIPVRLFKHYELRSIPPEAVFKTLTSSGTSGQAPSRIVLDKDTAQRQTAALVKIMQDFLGKARLPMLIIDHPDVVRDRRSFSARGAGILGLSNFGRGHVYALGDDMRLNVDAVLAFARQHQGSATLLFGFTFMVWQHFVLELERQGLQPDLGGATLLHSGGWKKLQALAVDNAEFKRRVQAATGITRVHNFYGMVEQVGSVFVECEHGHLHTPAFADVVAREPGTWAPLPDGEAGVLQVLSCLPHSYPGHSLLTEDLGTVLGEDSCPCGRLGRYLQVHGRVPQAELRGCSDTQPTVAAVAS
jgi:hypothetical protein